MIGVSIVTFRSGWLALAATVDGLNRQSRQIDRLLVHANAADETEARALRDQLTAICTMPFDLTSSGENLGFCGGHNRNLAQLFEQGVSAALLLNPDLVLEPTAIGAFVECTETLGARGLYGPILEFADPETFAATGIIDTAGTVWVRGARHLDARQGEPMSDLPVAPYETAAISGACVWVPHETYREVVDRSGEFLDDDFIAYREDAELGLRASLLGIPSRIVPSARGRHVRRLRGTQRGLDPHIDALSVRNRFLLAFKYGRRRPGGLVSALARDALVLGGVFVGERTSMSAVREAWRLRPKMLAKRRRLQREIDAPRR